MPLRWDDPKYAQFMLLSTILGGYFGSRLMSNLREDKGYTYGINCHTQIYSGNIGFYISTDVAGGVGDKAVEEIRKEIDRIKTEPISEEELEMTKMIMAGDFIRSVDGIFEKATRYCDMKGTDVTETLTDNIRTALETTTVADIKEAAECVLREDDLVVCMAGKR